MVKSAAQPDAIIIGGGHNGLTCAIYLARAGMKVRIVEARGVVGGAAVTQEFHPGFRNSVASYTVSLLQPRVIADMALVQRGYRVIERPVSNFLPLPVAASPARRGTMLPRWCWRIGDGARSPHRKAGEQEGGYFTPSAAPRIR